MKPGHIRVAIIHESGDNTEVYLVEGTLKGVDVLLSSAEFAVSEYEQIDINPMTVRQFRESVLQYGQEGQHDNPGHPDHNIGV